MICGERSSGFIMFDILSEKSIFIITHIFFVLEVCKFIRYKANSHDLLWLT